MPTAPLRPCSQAGCPNLVTKGRCQSCGGEVSPEVRKSMYDTPEWRAIRREHLAANPRCQCEIHEGKADAPRAVHVDHLKPHRGDPKLFYDRKNLSSRAHSCHASKTARTDGWGNDRYDDQIHLPYSKTRRSNR